MILYKLERPEKIHFYVISLLNKIIKTFTPIAEIRNTNIKCKNLSKDKLVKLDPILYETAIRNLIDNAIKYSEPESNVLISTEMSEKYYKITIKNKINKKISTPKKELFKRFKRGVNSENIIGTGLGLSIVSEIMQGLKGFKIEYKKEKYFALFYYFHFKLIFYL